MRKGKVKRILSAGLSAAIVLSGLQMIPAEAANEKTYTTDLSQTDGELIPKTGWLLTPNESLPDGRIIPLNTSMVRDDWESQNIWGHHSDKDVPGTPLDTPDWQLNEHNRFERMKHGIERLTELGIEYYPITAYVTSWIGDGASNSSFNMEDVPAFRQYVKDMIQYFKDNDLPVNEVDVWNEYANGVSQSELLKMYEESWWATRSVTPDARMIGPSSTSYQDNLGSVKGLADYCEKAGITLDKAAWHFGDTTTLKEFQESLEDYISQKPAVGQTEYYYEEYNGRVKSAYDELVAISNIDRRQIYFLEKGAQKINLRTVPLNLEK